MLASIYLLLSLGSMLKHQKRKCFHVFRLFFEFFNAQIVVTPFDIRGILVAWAVIFSVTKY